MNSCRVEQLKKIYSHALFDDVIPFWMKYSLDTKYGGYYHYLDRDGTILSTDKAIWLISRQVWLFSKLYNTVEKREEWIKAAKLGYDFLEKYCFDDDGRMFFQVTYDGRPLRKRRYWYAETFGILGCAEYAKASKSDNALRKARDIYKTVVRLYKDPSSLPPKIIPETRSLKSHTAPMLLLSTSQIMREVDNNQLYDEIIGQCINEVFNNFVKRDKEALLEVVGPNGEFIDLPQGRCINPGHSMETSWFLIHEGLLKNNKSLIKSALEILEWSFIRGWDSQYGGIFSFVDVDGKPPEQVEWDMKYWWPHNETMYALLLAHHITGDKKYEKWYEMVHEWSFKHFPDPEYGEWYGYLHRDGSVALPIKGSVWKGSFHLSRFLLNGLDLLDKM